MTATTTMDPIEVAEALGRVGLKQRVGKTLDDLIADYQLIHGLKVDGIAGAVTERHLAQPRFCGNVDRLTMNAVSQMCRWDDTNWNGSAFVGPPTTVTRHYFVSMPAPRLTLAQTQLATQMAFTEIAKHGAVACTPVDSAAAANIVIAFGQIDGNQGVLAQTGLPCGPDTPKTRMSFEADNAEVWVMSEAPTQGNIDIVRVFTHEFLHFFGLEHGPAGNLMAPFYDPTIRTMQAWDIQQLQLRYGPVQLAPAPPVVPPTPLPTPSLLQGTVTVRLNSGDVLSGEVVSTKA